MSGPKKPDSKFSPASRRRAAGAPERARTPVPLDGSGDGLADPVLDPELFDALLPRVKRQLRGRMRALRKAHPKQALAERSLSIVQAVQSLEVFSRAPSLGLYWPMPGQGEVDLRALDSAARAARKRVYYPFMERVVADASGRERGATPEQVFRTGFREVTDPSELCDRGHGFVEPDPSLAAAERGDISLILVPALAVSESGHRLGQGLGFYDATLPDFCPPAVPIVVAYEFQLLAEIPNERHDYRCTGVVTEKRVIQL